MSAVESLARDYFARETANHEMKILRDDGLYRHLRFNEPGSWMYGYDLVTWPGFLTIEGDIDSSLTFSRIPDMFEFFASGPDINPHYWAEKITNREAQRATRCYSVTRLHEYVERAFENAALAEDRDRERIIVEAWAEHTRLADLDDERTALEALRDFGPVEGFHFADYWEADLREWTLSYLRCCLAIRAGVEQYLASRPVEAAA